jgi:CDGSH-type Zn-finger protein
MAGADSLAPALEAGLTGPPDARSSAEVRSSGPFKRSAEVTVTPYRDGPYLLRGAFTLRDQNGSEIPNSRRVVALCRCGKSRTRPFCDGTHRLIDFRAPSGSERALEAAAAGDDSA